MIRIGLVVFVVGLVFSSALANHAKRGTKGVFFAQNGRTIKVYVDGQLVNRFPQTKVDVELLPGNRHIKLKVYNRRGRVDFVVNNRVKVNRGFVTYFGLGRNKHGGLAVKKIAQNQYIAQRSGRDYYSERNRRSRHSVRRSPVCIVSY